MQIVEIIRALGGAPAVSRGLGFPPGDVGAKRVRAWATRNSIPSEYWSALSAYSDASGLGITLEVLAAAHAGIRTEAA